MGKGSPTPDNQLTQEELRKLYTEDKYVCTLSPELVKIAKKELREDEKTREQALDQMRQWIKKTSYIKDCRLGMLFVLFQTPGGSKVCMEVDILMSHFVFICLNRF